MLETIKIPKVRIKVIFGQNGYIKKKIEKLLKCKLNLFEENLIEINCTDPMNLFKAKMMIEGIGRGFNFEDISCLTNDLCVLRVINLQDILGKNDKRLTQIKGRIIGKQGKIKKQIERRTNTKISVFGKTVSLVGMGSDVHKAEEIIYIILEGRKFSTVFGYLERINNDNSR